MSRFVALVPLRGGSKSIPGKNIMPVGGKPLCYWILQEALSVSEIEKVYVSTDDQAITDCVLALKTPRLEVIERPAELASDTASTESVMLHFAEIVPFDYLITLQATSPLTKAEDIRRGITEILDRKADSLVTGVISKRFYWTPEGKPLNYEPSARPRRQDFSGTIIENGAFYITRRELLLDKKCRLGGKITVLEMAPETLTEIDEPQDLVEVERLLQKRCLKNLFTEIRLLVLDVDGSLTDGGMYYGESGEALKKFNTRDARGLSLLSEKGIHIAVITGEKSPATRTRCQKMGIDLYFEGIQDKRSVLKKLCRDLKVSLAQTAFFGDDLGDLECLDLVGLSAAPADAVPEVREAASYVCRKEGGKGAVRELCDLIRKKQSFL